jgi:hypothetical protein
MRKVRPFLCLARWFYLHFESSPSYARDSSQRVPRHISPYCPQNSYTDWFCPGGSVCSIPLGKSLTFSDLTFLANGLDNPPSNLTWTQVCFYISTDTKKVGFPWVNCLFWYHTNHSLFWSFL